MHCDYCMPVACFCNTARPSISNLEACPSVNSHTAKECRMDVLKFLGINPRTEHNMPVNVSQAGSKSKSVMYQFAGNIMELIGATPRMGSFSQRNNTKPRSFGNYSIGGSNSKISCVPLLPPGSFSVNPSDGRKVRPWASDLSPEGLASPTCVQVSYPPGVDEEAGTRSAQDSILYTQCEIARRMANPAYALACREQTFDLTISIPIQLPYSTIVVDVLSGENYFGKRREFPDLMSAPHSDHSLFGRGISSKNTLSARWGLTTDKPQLLNVKDPTTNKFDSACDTWASFLRIKLGTVYNVREHQLKLVAETLRSSLSKSIFENPITFNATGINCIDDEGMIVDTPVRFGELRRDNREYHYVTHLKPSTTEDLMCIIMVRQRIKNFASKLVKHFGYARGPGVNNAGLTPIMHVELDPNFSSVRLMSGTVQLVIREYSPVLPAWIADMVWTYEDGEYVNTSRSVLKSKVETTEIRLEHQKGRMIDPRWPKELVIGRRIGGYSVGEPLLSNLTRLVYSRRRSPISFLYRAGFLEYMQDADYPHDSEAKKEDIQACMLNTKFQREVASHLKFEPSAGMSARIMHDDMSPTQAPIPVLHRRRSPTARQACVSSNVASGDTKFNVNAQPFEPSTKDTKSKGTEATGTEDKGTENTGTEDKVTEDKGTKNKVPAGNTDAVLGS